MELAPSSSPRNLARLPRRLARAGAASLALLFTACASTKIPTTALTGSDPEALSIITASQRAHGSEAFAGIRDLKANYGSEWNRFGARGPKEVWDRRYRHETESALELGTGTMVQLHKGRRSGRKFVLRAPGRVTVWYNGQPDSREEVLRATALMADVEKMELLGPLYFQRPGVIFEKLEPAKVDGAECEQILAVIRPGFGYANEDRVLLAIDRETHRLRRASLTLRGLADGKEPRLDVTFTTWAQRSGVTWATQFREAVPNLLRLSARSATLIDLGANRGFTPTHPEMIGEAVSAALERDR